MDRRTTLKQRRQDQVREEILAAARKVVLSEGLGGLTLTAVARELGLTKAALYHYFASKETLVFELTYLSLESQAEAVGDAVAGSTSGVEAIEALMRAAAAHYAPRKDELRLAYLIPQVGKAAATRFGADQLARIRPFNERMYGAVAEKIHQDQKAGQIPEGIDGRRLAFLAHTAILGMLTLEGLVETADEAPLIHSHEAMVEELVRTFTARLAAPA